MHYLSVRYTERLAEAGIAPSMGSVGDSYGNALAETIIGLCKTEVIRRNGPWRNIEETKYAALEWVGWFDKRTLPGPIGNMPLAEHEVRYHKVTEWARLNHASRRTTRMTKALTTATRSQETT